MKIAIVGAGTSGLVLAWLLAKDHNVVVFESQDRIGGHAHTVSVPINGKMAHVDVGFEFFNDSMYPYFNRLLKRLNVPIHKYELTHTYYHQDHDDCMVLPPMRNKKMLWNSLSFQNIYWLLQLGYVFTKAKTFVKQKNIEVTIQEFIDRLTLTSSFKDRFFTPFMAGGWGTSPILEFKKFSAFDVLSWLIGGGTRGLSPPIWNEVKDGVSQYIQALAEGLKENVQIKTSTPITHLSHTNQQYQLTTQQGEIFQADHLILATNAKVASCLLKGIPNMSNLSTALGCINYFPVKIAVHSDPALMPKDKRQWSVSNVRHNNLSSALSVYKPWKGEIFRSWLFPEDKIPNPLYALLNYELPMVNKHFFEAQQSTKRFQGYQNLWIAGMHTHEIDSHESAVISAISIAKRLCPSSQRLNDLICQ